jgi:uncharacterized protein YjbI with pentapeptide repeats
MFRRSYRVWAGVPTNAAASKEAAATLLEALHLRDQQAAQGDLPVPSRSRSGNLRAAAAADRAALQKARATAPAMKAASESLSDAIAAAVAGGCHTGALLEGRQLDGLPPLAEKATADVSTSLRRCDLRNSDFAAGNVYNGCAFDQCDARRASFAGCETRWSSFAGANLEKADLTGAFFAHCSFHRASLVGARVSGAVFFACDFTLADLSALHTDGATTFQGPEGWELSRRLGWQGASPRVVLANADAASSLPPRAANSDRGHLAVLP